MNQAQIILAEDNLPLLEAINDTLRSQGLHNTDTTAILQLKKKEEKIKIKKCYKRFKDFLNNTKQRTRHLILIRTLTFFQPMIERI